MDVWRVFYSFWQTWYVAPILKLDGEYFYKVFNKYYSADKSHSNNSVRDAVEVPRKSVMVGVLGCL
jgi:hypothetical protein